MIHKKTLVYLLIAAAVIFPCCSNQLDDEQLHAYSAALSDYYRGNYPDCESAALIIAEHTPSFHQARLLLAKALFMQNKFEESRKELSDLCGKYNIYTEAEKWYIRSLLQTGKDKKALEEINRVLAFDPENPDFLLLAASVHAGLGNLQEQIRFLAQVPVHADRIARAHLELARIYYSWLEHEKALAEIDLCLHYLPADHLLEQPVQKLRLRIIENRESE